jgi:glycosyltransferase involved in cell wall biosynthesis
MKISVLIPTRNRCDLLKYAIQTVVTQSYENLEILVSDNCSEDETRRIVESFDDPRVRYVRTASRLSMVDNFEHAYLKATGDIVISIGDDDGIAVGAIAKAAKIFTESNCTALTCDHAHYTWPNAETSFDNVLLFSRKAGYATYDTNQYLEKVVYEDYNYQKLPGAYYTFQRRSFLDEFRRKFGRLFLTNQVDISSSIGFSTQLSTYCHSYDPLVIAGLSRRSNGASLLGISKSIEERRSWDAETSLSPIYPFKTVGSVPFLIAEAIFTLQKIGIRQRNYDQRMRSLIKLARARAVKVDSQAIDAIQNAVKYFGIGSVNMEFRRFVSAGSKFFRLINRLTSTTALDLGGSNVFDIYGASIYLSNAKHYMNSASLLQNIKTLIRRR